ncbi:unnamed protein product [Adineta steineri]|uniref:Uncharacterized protein n=1 Tax=Adineta steineri TaxID=433720 RepID=A0A819TCC0_9BILA|nr:unnamed protein product [Adineta steineri]
MLFEMTLIKFDASQIMGADAFLGSLCFTLFIFLVVFVCLTKHFTIGEGTTEGKISVPMLKIGVYHQAEIQEERDCRVRSQYVDPIENFPNKMDQFLEALNRIYIDQKIELSRLEKAGV